MAYDDLNFTKTAQKHPNKKNVIKFDLIRKKDFFSVSDKLQS